jgi:hypothetical protein
LGSTVLTLTAFISSIVIGPYLLLGNGDEARGMHNHSSEFISNTKKMDSLCRMWLFLSHPSQRKSAVLNPEGKK